MAGEGAQQTKLLLRVVDLLDDGVEPTCKKLQDVIDCVKNNTKTCDGSETGKCKKRFEGLKTTRQKLCVDDKKDLADNIHCISEASFKNGIDACEHHIAGFTQERKPSCEVLQKTEDCLDEALKKCPVIHDTLDEIFDKYLQNYFLVDNCDLDHNDVEDDDDSASVSLSTISLLLISLILSTIITKL